MIDVWKKIRAVTDTSMFNPVTSSEHDGEWICNPDEIFGQFSFTSVSYTHLTDTFRKMTFTSIFLKEMEVW